MYVVIEYSLDYRSELEVEQLHGPFDYENQAYDWVKEHSRAFSGGFDVMQLSSVT